MTDTDQIDNVTLMRFADGELGFDEAEFVRGFVLKNRRARQKVKDFHLSSHLMKIVFVAETKEASKVFRQDREK